MNSGTNVTMTGKDLGYLSDMFNWNLNAYHTICHFESMIQNEEFKTFACTLKQMHLSSCSTLVGVISNAR